MTLATVMVYPLVRLEWKSTPSRERRSSDILIFLLLAVVGVFPGQVIITWGTRKSLASNAALLMLTLPVSTAFLAFLCLHERMTPVRWISFGLAIVGVLMCCDIDFRTLNFGRGYLHGNVLIFIGTLGSAFYNSYGKKVLERYSPTEMLFFTYLAMFVVMTPLTLAQEPGVFAAIPRFTLQTWIGLALLTFFHNYLSMVLLLKALKQFRCNSGGVIQLPDHILWDSPRGHLAKGKVDLAGDCRWCPDLGQVAADHRLGNQTRLAKVRPCARGTVRALKIALGGHDKMTGRRGSRQPGKLSIGRSQRRSQALICANAGIVGMGLMGSSIAACLLAAGRSVAAVEVDPAKLRKASRQVLSLLEGLRKERLLRSEPRRILQKLTASSDYSVLRRSEIVVECVTEDLGVKRDVIRKIEQVVSASTIIGSNTSALPPTMLQEDALHPERILGIHWAEPAHITRFMEIICGKDTRPDYAERALALARQLGKEPSLLRKDVRGFITNRVMYAMLREAFHLVESGVASIADIDRSLRNDLGYWITFAGPFRFMDLTGIPAYCAVMRDLLPDLDCSNQVPPLMARLVESGAQGVANAKGFYNYTPAQAKRWEKRFLKFSYEVRALARKYPKEVGAAGKIATP